MNCRYVKDHLFDAASGATPESHRIWEHAAECPECERVLRRARDAMSAWVEVTQLRESSRFVGSVLDNIERPALVPFAHGRPAWQLALQPAVAAMLLAACVWLGSFLGGNSTSASAQLEAADNFTAFNELTWGSAAVVYDLPLGEQEDSP